MFIVGCDYQPSVQQTAWVDTESGECGELRLRHCETAEQFYRELKKKGVSVRRVSSSRPLKGWIRRQKPEKYTPSTVLA